MCYNSTMIQKIYMKAKYMYIDSYKNTKCSTPSILKWSKNNKYCIHYKWWNTRHEPTSW